ncbi:hypothetical protein AOLI_G00190320 [Acnodon oligacanthus]
MGHRGTVGSPALPLSHPSPPSPHPTPPPLPPSSFQGNRWRGPRPLSLSRALAAQAQLEAPSPTERTSCPAFPRRAVQSVSLSDRKRVIRRGQDLPHLAIACHGLQTPLPVLTPVTAPCPRLSSPPSLRHSLPHLCLQSCATPPSLSCLRSPDGGVYQTGLGLAEQRDGCVCVTEGRRVKFVLLYNRRGCVHSGPSGYGRGTVKAGLRLPSPSRSSFGQFIGHLYLADAAVAYGAATGRQQQQDPVSQTHTCTLSGPPGFCSRRRCPAPAQHPRPATRSKEACEQRSGEKPGACEVHCSGTLTLSQIGQ